MAKAKKKPTSDRKETDAKPAANVNDSGPAHADPDLMSLDEMLAEALEADLAKADGQDSGDPADSGGDTNPKAGSDAAGDDGDPDDAEQTDGLDQEAEIEALRAERDDMRDRFMRALADAENARKRSERDRREAETYGGSKLSRDLLPVHDNLKRALDAAREKAGKDPAADTQALIEGVELTMRELISVFQKHGIHPLTPEIGSKFDPQVHQAMFEAPVPGTKAGDIIQVMADGFILHDRLLRPAQVGVSSTPAS
jgi:molecular chaperone GrpE